LGGSDLAAEICLAGFAEFAFAAFWCAKREDVSRVMMAY